MEESDRLKITAIDGNVYRFKLEPIEDTCLMGKQIKVPFSQIDAMQIVSWTTGGKIAFSAGFSIGIYFLFRNANFL